MRRRDLNRHSIWVALMLPVLMPLYGCWGPVQSTESVSNEGFRINFLKEDWEPLLNTTTELDESWAILSKVDLSEHLAFAVTINDIETYDWSSQSITLTTAGTQKLERTLSDLQYVLFLKCFIVTLNGRRLYGGVFLDSGTAIGIRYPTIDLHRGTQDMFTLSPGTPNYDFSDYPPEMQKVIARQDVHDYFAALGKLIE